MRSHCRQKSLLLKTKKKRKHFKSSSQTFCSIQGKLTDLSVGLLSQKRLLQFCNAHKQEMKGHFSGENLCRQPNSKQLYQFHPLPFGGSVNATVSLSLKLFLLRIGIVEINRGSTFSSLIFVFPLRFLSFQHSQ